MTTEPPDDIQRVIAQVATLKYLAIGAVAVAVVALAVAAVTLLRARPLERIVAPTTLDTSELTIRDAAGNVRGRWSVQGLSLADEHGRMRAGLSLSDAGGPNLTLFSRHGGVRAVIGLGSEDSPGITLHDEKSRVRTRIVIGAEDAPSVLISNAEGDVIGRLPAPIATPALKARTGR